MGRLSSPTKPAGGAIKYALQTMQNVFRLDPDLGKPKKTTKRLFSSQHPHSHSDSDSMTKSKIKIKKIQLLFITLCKVMTDSY